MTKPSKFEFIIRYKGVLYSYGFRLNSNRIFEEWLWGTPKTREVLYFQRTTSKGGKSKIDFGPSLTGRSSHQKQFLEFVAQGTRPNQLFLTQAVDQNVNAVKPVFEWFKDVLTVVPADSRYTALELRLHKNKTFTKFLGDFLREAGTGIDAITTEEKKLDFDGQFRNASETDKVNIRNEIKNIEKDSALVVFNPEGEHIVITCNKNGEPLHLTLKTQHRTNDGGTTQFDIFEESEGTQRLMNLIPALFSLQTSEKVYFIDELDRRLHPLLARMFLEVALNSDGTTKKGQLVFTTHDTNLLDLDLLRKDEIWFVEKDEHGQSHLYSLAEFNIRQDLKVSKGYLNGRFGAIPFIGDTSKLGWI